MHFSVHAYTVNRFVSSIQIHKNHRDENISRPGEAVNWFAYIKRFLHRCGFFYTVCGLFLPF